jgi:hypothetical protein
MVVLRASAPAATMDDEDGGTARLGAKLRLGHVEHRALTHVGAIGNVLGHFDAVSGFLGRYAEGRQQEQSCEKGFSSFHFLLVY